MTILAANPAAAGHGQSFYQLADDYRDAVSHFEDRAVRIRTLDRVALRMIDDLDDAASDLRSAARRPEDSSRLLVNFNTVTWLQTRVEAIVFASRCPIIAAELGPCWNEVSLRYTILATQLQAYTLPGCSIGSPTQVHSGPSGGRFPNSGYANPSFGGQFPIAPPLGYEEQNFRGPLDVAPRGRGFGAGVPPHGIPRSSLAAPVNVNSRDLGAAILGSLFSRVLH